MSATEIATRLEQAISERDLAGVAALLHPDAVYTAPGAAVGGMKVAEIESFFGAFFTSFPEGTMEIVTVTGAGDVATAEWIYHSGPMAAGLFGRPATGKSASARGARVITIEDERIKTINAYWDNQDLFAQLGFGS
jgi:steroid delta-isomerase-like uncharacterized protein